MLDTPVEYTFATALRTALSDVEKVEGIVSKGWSGKNAIVLSSYDWRT
jgi:hypothetical protein